MATIDDVYNELKTVVEPLLAGIKNSQPAAAVPNSGPISITQAKQIKAVDSENVDFSLDAVAGVFHFTKKSPFGPQVYQLDWNGQL